MHIAPTCAGSYQLMFTPNLPNYPPQSTKKRLNLNSLLQNFCSIQQIHFCNGPDYEERYTRVNNDSLAVLGDSLDFHMWVRTLKQRGV